MSAGAAAGVELISVGGGGKPARSEERARFVCVGNRNRAMSLVAPIFISRAQG